MSNHYTKFPPKFPTETRTFEIHSDLMELFDILSAVRDET